MSRAARGAAAGALAVLVAAAVVAPSRLPVAASGPAAIDLVVPRYLVAGGAPGTVIAQVRDAEGEPVADGITITFTASLGVLMNPIAAVTEDGRAVTTATPTTMSGFAQITAQAGSARDDQLLWVRPGPAASIAMLLAEPAVVPFAGSAEIVLRAVDAFGHAAEGDAVTWTVAGGSLSAPDAMIAGGTARASAHAAPDAGRLVVGVAVGSARGTLVIPVAADSAPWHAFLPFGLRAPR